VRVAASPLSLLIQPESAQKAAEKSCRPPIRQGPGDLPRPFFFVVTFLSQIEYRPSKKRGLSRLRAFWEGFVRHLFLAGPVLLSLAACASTPTSNTAVTETFDRPLPAVKKAALNALSVTGFDVEKDEPGYVEGFRPRKIGFFVGSGGETVGVWLERVDDQKTQVRVDTARSFVGIVGQKSWTADVLDEMRKDLAEAR
jgi:hypothetical protein